MESGLKHLLARPLLQTSNISEGLFGGGVLLVWSAV